MNRSTKDTLINLVVIVSLLFVASFVIAAKAHWRMPDITNLEYSDLPAKADEVAQADVEPTPTPTPPPTPTPNAGVFEITETSVPVYEGESNITVSVTRNEGSYGAVSVSYQSVNGSAIAGQDFQSLSGVLNWADGDVSEKKISLSIFNDSIVETDETFSLQLLNSTNGSIGEHNQVDVTIITRDHSALPSLLLPRQFGAGWLLPSYVIDNAYSDLSGTGDINGDGQEDVIVGAMFEPGPYLDENGSYITGCPYGMTYALTHLPLQSSNIDAENSAYSAISGEGSEMASASILSGIGDINGDGFNDFAIGNETVYTESPEACVVLGAAEFTIHSKLSELTNNAIRLNIVDTETFGCSIAEHLEGVGDVNGDGYSDFAIRDFNACNGTFLGYLVLGRQVFPNILQLDPAKEDGIVRMDNIASAGDFNGDGLDDIIYTAGEEVKLLFGTSGSFVDINGNLDLANLSYVNIYGELHTIGDINSDGYSDLGTVLDSSDSESTSTLGILFGGTDLSSLNRSDYFNGVNGVMITLPVSSKYLKGLGDVNADGYGDIGALELRNFIWDEELSNSPAPLEVVYGGPSGVGSLTPDVSGTINLGLPDGVNHSAIMKPSWCIGSYALAGDINLDGASDFLIGGVPMRGGAEYPCYVDDNGLSSALIMGKPNLNNVTYKGFVPSGTSPRRPIGVLANGAHSTPFSRCWAAYEGGDASLVSVTVGKTTTSLGNPPVNILPGYWEIDSERQGHNSADYTFAYFQRNVPEGAEGRLSILYSDSPSGPWNIASVVDRDSARNMITARVYPEDGNHLYFMISFPEGFVNGNDGDDSNDPLPQGPSVGFTSPEDGAVTSYSLPVSLQFNYDAGDSVLVHEQTTVTLDSAPAPGVLSLSQTSGSLDLGVLPSAVHTATVYVYSQDDQVASDTVHFRVETPPDPGLGAPEVKWNSAYVASVVYDADTRQPLDSASIGLRMPGSGGATEAVLSGTDGKFFLPVNQTGNYIVDIMKDDYVTAQRPVNVTMLGETFAVDPVYLQPLPPEEERTEIDGPTGGSTTVTSGSEPLITVNIPAGATQTENMMVGAVWYDHPEDLPSPLPESTAFTHAVELLPDGQIFDTTVTIAIKNTRGFAPGTTIPVGMYNYDTAQWQHEAVAVVSDDGTSVTWGVRHFSPWDCNASQRYLTYTSERAIEQEGDKNYPCSDQKSVASQSIVKLGRGRVYADVPLLSQGQVMNGPSLELRYSSHTANPHYLVEHEIQRPVSSVALGSKLTIHAQGRTLEGYFDPAPTDGVARMRMLYDCRDINGRVLPTGKHTLLQRATNVSTREFFTSNRFGSPAINSIGIDLNGTEIVGGGAAKNIDFMVHNQQDSPFGSGWGLKGLVKLNLSKEDEKQLAAVVSDGDGSIWKLNYRNTSVNYDTDFNVWDWGRSYNIVKNGTAILALDTEEEGTSLHLGDVTGHWSKVWEPELYASFVGMASSDDARYVALSGAYDNDWSEGVYGIFLLDLATHVIQQISPSQYGFYDDPTISATGNKIAYIRDFSPAHSSKYELFIYDRITGSNELIASASDDASNSNYIEVLAFSQNGHHLLYSGSGIDLNGQAHLYIYDTIKKQSMAIAETQYALWFSEASFSADGNRIAYSYESTDGVSGIMLYNVALNTTQALVQTIEGEDSSYCGTPVISDDGTTLLFLTNAPSILEGQVNDFGMTPVIYRIDEDRFELPSGFYDATLSYLNNIQLSPDNTFFTYVSTSTFNGAPVSVIPVGSANYSMSGLLNGELYVGAVPGMPILIKQPAVSYLVNEDNSIRKFDMDGYQTMFWDSLHNKTEYHWITEDEKKRVAEIVYPSGKSVTFEYTPDGRIVYAVDSQGRRTRLNINDNGDLVGITYPDGTSQNFSYDSRHLMTAKTEPGGFRTDYHWDDLGFIKSIDAPERTEASVDTETGAALVSNEREHWTYQVQDAVGTILPKEQSGGGPGSVLANQAPLVFDSELYLEERLNGRVIQHGKMTDFKHPAETRLGNSGNVSNKYSDDKLFMEKQTALGDTIQVDYNDQGWLTQLTDELSGSVLKVSYEAFSFGLPLVKSIADNLTTQTVFAYETASSFADFERVTGVTATDAAGHSSSWNYATIPSSDDIWALSSQTDWKDQVTRFLYNPDGSLEKLIVEGVSQLAMDYDARGNVTRMQTSVDSGPLLSTLQMQYNGNNRLAKLVDSDTGRTIRYGYDEAGHITMVELPLDRTTVFEYGPKNLLSKVTTPDGNTSKIYYDDQRLLALVERSDGGRSSFVNDDAGRLTAVFDPLGNKTRFEYNAADELTTVTDSTGRTSLREYDLAGRLTAALDGLGFGSHYTYNENNQVTSVTDALDRVTVYDYDYVNDKRGLLSRVEYADGTETNRTYDANGNLESQTDALGYTTGYAYDAADRLTTVTDARNGVTEFVYDALDRLRTQVLPDGTSITTELNSANEIASQAYPSGNAVSYVRDAAGRLIGTVADDNHTSWSYDVMDRPTRASNEAAVLGWGYDGPSGVLTSTTQQNLAQPGLPVYTTRRIYDSTHTRLEQVVYPSGDTVDYTYDDAGRVTGLAHAGAGAAADVGAYSFTYDERGLPETMTAPNGLVTRYWRDKAGRVVAQKTVRQSDSAVVLQEEYGYDSVGNKTFKTASWDGPSGEVTKSDLYQFDDGSQVIGVRYGVPAARTDLGQITYNELPRPPTEGGYDDATAWDIEEAWKFDALGNREWMTTRYGSGATSETAYYQSDIMNRYSVMGGFNFQYDPDGRITSTGYTTYVWTVEGRLKQVRKTSDNSLILEYAYDPLGRRISRTSGSSGYTVYYIWDGSHVIEERDASGAILAQYLWGPGHDQLLASRKAEYDAGWAYPVLGDLNSVATITNTSGQVLGRFHYSIYGLPSQIDAYGNDMGALNFSDHTNHLYNGQYWEEQLMLNMYRERWMSPLLGRFISPSALTYPVAELNYLFCFNNPVAFVDINGLAAMDAGIAMNGAVGNFVDSTLLLDNVDYSPTDSFLGDFAKFAQNRALELSGGVTKSIGQIPGSFLQMGRGTGENYAGMDLCGNDLAPGQVAGNAAEDILNAIGLGLPGLRGLKGLKRADEAIDAIERVETATELARRLGRTGEEAAKIIKNTQRIPSLTGTANYRIPDILDNVNNVIGEVKNVDRLSYSSQIKDYVQFAQANGYNFELYVRPTTRLSNPLQQAVSEGLIDLRLLP